METTTTTTPMSNDEIVENLKTMVFGVQAYKRLNAVNLAIKYTDKLYICHGSIQEKNVG